MKIRRIDIEQFGSLRGWHSGDLKDGVTVIFGPNESGKSTITEFIRGTLFPVRNVKYPQAKRGDSGSIEVEMDNGDIRRLNRDQKKVTEASGKRTVSEELNSMDAETYRALYGLDLEQLVNNKLITSGAFRSRFMTIPGGDDVPKVSDSIDARISELMNPERMSDTKIIGACLKDIRETEDRISEINSSKDRYDSLYAEREDLKRKVSEARTLIDASQDERLRKRMMRSQAANMKKLEELEAQLKDYEKYNSFELSEMERFDKINSSIEELNAQLPEGIVDDNGYEIIISRKEEIEAAYRGLGEYESKFQRIDDLNQENEKLDASVKEYQKKTGWSLEKAQKVRTGSVISNRADLALRREQGKTPMGPKYMLGAAIGLVLAVAGILMIANVIPVGSGLGIGLTAVGALVTAGSIALPHLLSSSVSDSNNWNMWIRAEGYPDGTTPNEAITLANDLQAMKDCAKKRDANLSEIRRMEAELSLYERTNEPIIRAMGIKSDISTGVEKLNQMLQQALVDEKEAERIKGIQDAIAMKEKERNSMIRKYGKPQEIVTAYEGKKELLRIRGDIATLTESIESSSGASLNDLRLFLSTDSELDVDELKDGSEIQSQRIGEINAEMDSIMKDDEISELQIKLSSAESRLEDAMREWAVYNIAKTLIRDACDHFYTDLQPDVVKKANAYLGLMTHDRYQLDNDPRNSETFIRDYQGSKSSTQWSSGLGDQVYLSLKMALASEMSAERIPMIMDDVLVRFDSDRKAGACEAIAEFGKENQVIMFTCDTEVVNYLRLYGNVNDIRL